MEFLTNTSNIRNICILAHVDHGKTTIADSLIASNGLISHRLAGKLRYLDNRQDEQERGITMKSSSIALKYTNRFNEKYLINLVDTPGHVDFCGEVSAAVRLCDGALVVVDVVEGICAQTKVALEQAWKEGIEPILVLNKIDRMILEQQLDETAAHVRLNQLLEQINAVVSTLLTTEIFEGDSNETEDKNANPMSTDVEGVDPNRLHVYDWASAIEDVDDSRYYFMPEKNNVIFASSIDDWAFTIGSMSRILSKKHKINLAALQRTLWGDYYIDLKQRRILKNAQSKTKKNLFVSMVLENIWRIYDSVCTRRDKILMAKICDVLDIQLSQRDINHNDSRYQTKLIMSRWLQLSKNVLESVTNIVPSPTCLSERRVERLLSSNLKRFNQLPPETQSLKKPFMLCSSDENALRVACVSKMIAVPRSTLPENRRVIGQPLSARPGVLQKTQESQNVVRVSEGESDDDVVFIAFARIFSGKFQKGDTIYVLGPKHDPSMVQENTKSKINVTKKLDDLEPNEHVTVATIDTCYLFMGRELETLDYASAGNIVGLRGLEKHLIRTATLSSDLYCPPFNDLHLAATPILRVALEPKNPLDMPLLVRGLKLLNQADPCVEVRLQENGEHVIIATGEVHLERCIKDLTERYTSNIELNVSQPIVPFRETVVLPPKTDMVNETINDSNMTTTGKKHNRKGEVEIFTPNKRCKIKMRAFPLPGEVITCLQEHSEYLKIVGKLATTRSTSASSNVEQLSSSNRKKISEFKEQMTKLIVQSRAGRPEWKHAYQDDLVERIWSFGPKYFGPNLLVASPGVAMKYSQWMKIEGQPVPSDDDRDNLHMFIDSFISGFQLATQSGPLCEEPMMGVCFIILEWVYVDLARVLDCEPSEGDVETAMSVNLPDPDVRVHHLMKDSYGPMSGQIISTVKECCRKSFQNQPQRLMSPMFSCDIQVTTEAMGKMYAVLGRRDGRIVHGDMREGSHTFEIKAFIPVIESLDFVSEIRKQTSGMANPQLIFSHYELIDVDPFWTPNTDEEYALYGEKADTENQARKYMNLVRRRKGLSVQEKIVEHGEKQRTVKRNK